MSVAIAFSNIGKNYRRQRSGRNEAVLRGFDFSIEPGELVAFVGPSGIGKTTLLHMAAGLEIPDEGAVAIGNGGNRSRIGMVFQQPRLLDWLTVQDNVALVARAAGRDPQRARGFLAAVGMADYADAFPLALSGGQRQRVALARAFAIDPEVLLLDEPFSALDELTARRLRLLLQDLWLSAPPTGLLVTHNTLEAAFLADRVIVLGDRPARIIQTIEIGLSRPRQPEDVRLFDLHRRIIAHLA